MSISVDTDELKLLATGLNGLVAPIMDIAGQVHSEGIRAGAAAGHPRVSEAIGEFSQNHFTNVSQLHEGLAQISARLGIGAGAAQALEETDTTVANEFRQ